jgi:hypothetical protein
MGIDITLSWRGQTTAECDAQVTGFSAVHGRAGYLREAYHGGPYVTKYLVAEAFAADEGEAAIPARVLRRRLPAAVLMHLYREHKVYGDGKDPGRLDDLADLKSAIANIFGTEVADISHTDFVAALQPESIATAEQLIAGGMLPDTAQSFVDFVELCERQEQKTGEPCTVHASY